VGVQGQEPLRKKNWSVWQYFASVFWPFFWHIVFANGFLILVKELGLLTNPSQWIRVLDATGLYMYIVL
jgi:hypothetical protein